MVSPRSSSSGLRRQCLGCLSLMLDRSQRRQQASLLQLRSRRLRPCLGGLRPMPDRSRRRLPASSRRFTSTHQRHCPGCLNSTLCRSMFQQAQTSSLLRLHQPRRYRGLSRPMHNRSTFPRLATSKGSSSRRRHRFPGYLNGIPHPSSYWQALSSQQLLLKPPRHYLGGQRLMLNRLRSRQRVSPKASSSPRQPQFLGFPSSIRFPSIHRQFQKSLLLQSL